MAEQPTLSFWHPAKLLCTWFGSGLSPKASGTAGSFAALPFAWLIQTQWGNTALFLASIIAFLVGWVLSNIYLRYTDALDPKEIVIDEVAGQWLILAFLYPSFVSYLIGFILFRAFDAVKPWPISVADAKIHGGFGVMFDDILAALYPLLLYVLAAGIASAIGHPFDYARIATYLAQNHVF